MNASLASPVVVPAVSRPAGETIALAAGVALVAWALPARSAGLDTFATAAPGLVLAVLVAGLAPDGRARAAQTGAMLLAFVAYRTALWEGPASLLLFAAPALAALAVRVLPVERPRVRKGLILVGTAALLLEGLGRIPHEARVLGAGLQALVLVEYFGRRKDSRRFVDTLRCMTAANATAVTPIPPEDALATDRSFPSRARGLLWIAVGFALVGLAEAGEGHAWLEPWRRLGEGRAVASLGSALAYWGWAIAGIAGILYVDAGILRLLGVPARPPLDAPWKSTSFLDYWRRANVYRHKMLVEVYFRNFFPTRGRWFPLGVFGVFLVSGLHHAATARFPDMAWLRWGVEGAVAAGNAELRERRARAAVRAFIAGGPRPRLRYPLLATLGVLLAHGYLMDLARPDAPTRRMILAFLRDLF